MNDGNLPQEALKNINEIIAILARTNITSRKNLN
jgi:hypothetical protein